MYTFIFNSMTIIDTLQIVTRWSNIQREVTDGTVQFEYSMRLTLSTPHHVSNTVRVSRVALLIAPAYTSLGLCPTFLVLIRTVHSYLSGMCKIVH